MGFERMIIRKYDILKRGIIILLFHYLKQLQELLDTPEEEEDQSQDLRVSIYIGRLRLLEGSSLLTSQYDGAQVFVEWNFLDFNRDICETPGTFALPRKSTDICMFDSERRK